MNNRSIVLSWRSLLLGSAVYIGLIVATGISIFAPAYYAIPAAVAAVVLSMMVLWRFGRSRLLFTRLALAAFAAGVLAWAERLNRELYDLPRPVIRTPLDKVALFPYAFVIVLFCW